MKKLMVLVLAVVVSVSLVDVVYAQCGGGRGGGGGCQGGGCGPNSPAPPAPGQGGCENSGGCKPPESPQNPPAEPPAGRPQRPEQQPERPRGVEPKERGDKDKENDPEVINAIRRLFGLLAELREMRAKNAAPQKIEALEKKVAEIKEFLRRKGINWDELKEEERFKLDREIWELVQQLRHLLNEKRKLEGCEGEGIKEELKEIERKIERIVRALRKFGIDSERCRNREREREREGEEGSQKPECPKGGNCPCGGECHKGDGNRPEGCPKQCPEEKCQKCNGEGQCEGKPCPKCNGEGKLRRPEGKNKGDCGKEGENK